MTKDQQDCWLAALVDGEGCISVYHNTVSAASVTIHIANTSVELLTLVRKITGCGTIPKYLTPNKDKHCYYWAISAKADVLNILDRITPYLVIKQQKAQVARAIAETIATKGRPDARTLVLRDKLTELWEQIKIQSPEDLEDRSASLESSLEKSDNPPQIRQLNLFDTSY